MTTKQKRAMVNMVENGGNASRAMIDAGYSPATAKNPSKLTTSKGYKALQKELGVEGISLKKALAPIAKALNAKTKIKVGEVVTPNGDDSSSVEYMYEYEDNIPLQLQGSDRAIKLLGIDKVVADATEEEVNDIQALTEAINNNVDEIELQRIVFKQKG
jgi:phage terminase small subunit